MKEYRSVAMDICAYCHRPYPFGVLTLCKSRSRIFCFPKHPLEDDREPKVEE